MKELSKSQIAAASYWGLGILFLLLLALSIARDNYLPSETPQPEEMPAELEEVTKLIESREYLEAKRQVQAFIEQRPDVADGHRLLAEINYAQGDIIESANNLEIAAALAPWDNSYAFTKANIYQGIGWYDKAIAVMDKILNDEPNNVNALLKRSELYLSVGAVQEGLNDLSYALVVTDNSNEILIRRAHFLANIGRFDEAELDLQPVIESGDPEWLPAAEDMLRQIRR